MNYFQVATKNLNINHKKSKKLQITAIVVTFNEEKRLDFCLQSLSFCNQIIVYDMGSTDNSLVISKKHTNFIKTISKVNIIEKIYPQIIRDSLYDWIILCDPDEILPNSIIDELEVIINEKPRIGLIHIPLQFYFLGKPLYSTIWGQKKFKSKTFHKKRVCIGENVHDGISLIDNYESHQIEWLEKNAISHYWVDSIPDLIKKHWRYIKYEGKAQYEREQRISIRKFFGSPIRSLFDNLFKYDGIKDGYRGIFLSFFYFWYVVMGNFSLILYQISLIKKQLVK
jgi:hypothetical protein